MTSTYETIEASFSNNTKEVDQLLQQIMNFANRAEYRERLHHNETVSNERWAKLLKISLIAGEIQEFACKKANEIAAIDDADFNAENK